MSNFTLTVKELITTDFKNVGPQTTIAQARKLTHFNKRVLVITVVGRLLGLVSSGQLQQTDLLAETELSSIMAKDFLTLDETALQQDIREFMPAALTRPLVVFAHNKNIYGLTTPEVLFHKLINKVLEKDAQLNTVLDTVVEAICIINQDDQVIAWNKRAEKLYGIKAVQILGQKVDNYFSNLMITKVIKQRQEIRSAYHRPCPGTHVLLSASPVKSGEQIIGGISAEKDITELVQLNQELTKANTRVQELKKEINSYTQSRNPFAQIKGRHPSLLALLDLARKVASSEADILIQGEIGTGKEMLARVIHQAGTRAEEPFIVVNCDAIAPADFRQELFGTVPGTRENLSHRTLRKGLLTGAQGGTIFLGEIGAMPLEIQAKLVQVLEEGLCYLPGQEEPVRMNVRLIASTTRRPEDLMQQKLLREDLYYRLNVVTLKTPALRERREDIPELAYFYLEEFCRLNAKKITRIEPTVIAALLAYDWPGNIAELKNVIQRMVILTEKEVITEQVLPATIMQTGESTTPQVSLTTASRQAERDLIVNTLKQTNGNRSKAARLLNIPRSTLYYKLHQLGLL